MAQKASENISQSLYDFHQKRNPFWQKPLRITRNVLGPIGPGPSSSHTIAPFRAASEAVKSIDALPIRARIVAFNSFCTTGEGHGTFNAIIAGLLGFEATDPRLPQAHLLAPKLGLEVAIEKKIDPSRDENEFELLLWSDKDFAGFTVVSTGGGNYRLIDNSHSSSRSRAV